jgi:hypothetical protein
MKEQYIRLRRREVQGLIRDLNLLVVSLDRLGSTFFDDPTRLAFEKDKFLKEVFAFKMLAKARSVLWVAYESQLGRAEMERFEERLENVKVWGEKGFRRSGKRKPKK